jgi:hypothetical protein
MKAIIKIQFITFCIITILFAQSCSKDSSKKNGELKNFTGLDGCGWIIALEDGTNLEPTNLTEFDVEFVDGNKILVEYKQSNVGASICMVGEIVEIKSIKER